MMETNISYWSKGTVEFERLHGGRLLRLLRIPPGKEVVDLGYLACFVLRENGSVEGLFRARHCDGGAVVGGYLSKRLRIEYEGDRAVVDAEVYAFDGVELSEQDQPEAVATYVASLLDYDYCFPNEAGAVRIDGTRSN